MSQPVLDEVLYSEHNPDGRRWHICYWVSGRPPALVRFMKAGPTRKLLDQVAQWTPDGWDPKRWQPRPPLVPQAVLDVVEAKLRSQQ